MDHDGGIQEPKAKRLRGECGHVAAFESGSQIFRPFRALGLITDSTPFALQHHDGETFATISLGKSYQMYNVRWDPPWNFGSCSNPGTTVQQTQSLVRGTASQTENSSSSDVQKVYPHSIWPSDLHLETCSLGILGVFSSNKLIWFCRLQHWPGIWLLLWFSRYSLISFCQYRKIPYFVSGI